MLKTFFSLPIDKLALIAAVGGVAGLTAIYSARNSFTEKVSKQKFFTDAVEKLKGNEGAKFILGTPIVTKGRCRHFCFDLEQGDQKI
jgi:hypothetical protein